MRTKRRNDASVVRRRDGSRARDDDRNVDRGRCDGHRYRTTTGAEAGTGVLAVAIGGRVIVPEMASLRHLTRHLHPGRVMAVLGATVEAPRIEQGSLEPDGPNDGEGAEPRGAMHHVQTIGRVGVGSTLRT